MFISISEMEKSSDLYKLASSVSLFGISKNKIDIGFHVDFEIIQKRIERRKRQIDISVRQWGKSTEKMLESLTMFGRMFNELEYQYE